MTFGQYYIAQFKEIPNVWKIAKRFNKKWAFLGTVSLLLVPTYIYMMYLYDTGKMQVDTRYMKQKPIKKYCGRCKKEIKDSSSLFLNLDIRGASNCNMSLCESCANDFALFTFGNIVDYNHKIPEKQEKQKNETD